MQDRLLAERPFCIRQCQSIAAPLGVVAAGAEEEGVMGETFQSRRQGLTLQGVKPHGLIPRLAK